VAIFHVHSLIYVPLARLDDYKDVNATRSVRCGNVMVGLDGTHLAILIAKFAKFKNPNFIYHIVTWYHGTEKKLMRQ